MEPFRIDGRMYLAVPQLAEDIAADPPNMNGGNSDVDTIVFVRGEAGWEEHQRLPSHGGESACFFQIEMRSFLVIAQIRSGTNPDFDYEPSSVLYSWEGGRFVPTQAFSTWAAKHAYFFRFAERCFLGFAEAVQPPDKPVARDGVSHIHEWSGESFEPFAELPSAWGYGFTHVPVGGGDYLALADHGGPSVLYRWTGTGFEAHQSFGEFGGGRHFASCAVDGDTYLVFANLTGGTGLHRWDGGKFVGVQELDGDGARHLRFFEQGDSRFLFRTNFITGDRSAPVTAMESQLYRFEGGRLSVVETYPTEGGTEASPFTFDGRPYVAVSNSLSPDARFRTDTVIYSFEGV